MKWYVLIIFLVTGLSMSGLLIIFLNTDPYKTTILTKYLFFTSFFVAIWGFTTLVFNGFKVRMDWPDFRKSFKMGFVVSVSVSVIYASVLYIK